MQFRTVLFLLVILGLLVSCIVAVMAEETPKSTIQTWPQADQGNIFMNKTLWVFPEKPINELGRCEASVAGSWGKNEQGTFAYFVSDSYHPDKLIKFVFRATLKDGKEVEERFQIKLYSSKLTIRERVWGFLNPVKLKFDPSKLIPRQGA